jgi:hypothetical protein
VEKRTTHIAVPKAGTAYFIAAGIRDAEELLPIFANDGGVVSQ